VGIPFPLDGLRAEAGARGADLPGSHQLPGYLRANTASYGEEENVVLVDAPAIEPAIVFLAFRKASR